MAWVVHPHSNWHANTDTDVNTGIGTLYQPFCSASSGKMRFSSEACELPLPRAPLC